MSFTPRQLRDIQTDKATNQNGKLRKLNWKRLRKGGPVPEPFASVAGQSSEDLSDHVKAILDAAAEDLEDGNTKMVKRAVAYATTGMTDEEKEEVFGRYPALAKFMKTGSDSDLDEPADGAQVNPSGGGMWPLTGRPPGCSQRSTDNQNQSFTYKITRLTYLVNELLKVINLTPTVQLRLLQSLTDKDTTKDEWQLFINNKEAGGANVWIWQKNPLPSVEGMFLLPEFRGYGYGKIFYLGLAEHYGTIQSSHEETAPSARYVWKSLGAKRLRDKTTNGQNRYELTHDKKSNENVSTSSRATSLLARLKL